MPPVNYEVRIDVEELVAEIRDIYSQFLAEVIADEPYNEGDVDEINDLRAHRWPSLDDVVLHERALFVRVLRRFLAVEVLDKLLPTPLEHLRRPSYMIDTVDDVSARESAVIFSGRAYPFNVRPPDGE